MKVAITGSSGYIGCRLVAALGARHVPVLHLGRTKPATPGDWLPFDLSSATAPQLPDDTTVLVHLAVGKQNATGPDTAAELAAAKALFLEANRVGARMIFVSSQTARANAPSKYGRTKFEIETLIISEGGFVVRPGQVYGGSEKGLFGILCILSRTLPALPFFLPDPQVQPVHVDDLVEVLISASNLTAIEKRVFNACAPESIGFSRFLAALSRHRVRRTRWMLPVPAIFVTAANTMVPTGIAERIGLDRLMSLLELPVLTSAADLNELGVTLRSLETGMARCGNRSLLAREGHDLLRHLLREDPKVSLVLRYARGVDHSVLSKMPLELITDWRRPGLFAGNGAVLPVHRDIYRERIRLATRIAEASPQGAKRFLAPMHGDGPVHALFLLFRAGVGELITRAATALRSASSKRGKVDD